jgi:enamine deaminase RidA (YjgF/YER057c/UK114 family)
MTTVAAGSPLVFIGNIDGGDGLAPRDQWLHAFEKLARVLRDSGSSFRHMAKATYFLADPAAREFLGEIRSVYYDPARPPAASAVDVQSIGVAGRGVALDMIVVPAQRAPAPAAPK